MADISNVVNVSVNLSGSLARYSSINAVAIFTSEENVAINKDKRTKLYKTLKQVGEDFGIFSETYKKCQAFFGTRPNSVQSGGNLYLCFYNKGEIKQERTDDDKSNKKTRASEETPLEALHLALNEVAFFGFSFIDQLENQVHEGIADYCQANEIIGYAVLNDLETAKKITNKGNTYYRMFFSKFKDTSLSIAGMSRVHTVNFSGENTAMTLHGKELNVMPEDLSDDEINKAKEAGLDVYVLIKDTPLVLCSGQNDYVDNVYNILAYRDALETEFLNLLKGTATKIPQTERGIALMIDCGEKVSRRFERAGVIGSGEWSSPDTFGNYDDFMKSIRDKGFYWNSGSLADQPQTEREERKSVVLQNAIKLSGAVHSIDVIVTVNK